MAILGTSGCGETSLLSLLGSCTVQQAVILYHGEDIEKTGLAEDRLHPAHCLWPEGGVPQSALPGMCAGPAA